MNRVDSRKETIMLSKTLLVKPGSELYTKVKALEDVSVVGTVYGNLNSCIDIIVQCNILGGEHGRYIDRLNELREEVRDELLKYQNKIIGLDEDTEIVIG